jgi:cysteine desulfuration protein SufE
MPERDGRLRTGIASRRLAAAELAHIGHRPGGGGGAILTFAGDSDAHIVRGLIAVLFALYSGKGAKDILSTDAVALFEKLGLRDHLTPQRSNGFRSMVERIRRDADAALATVS